MRACPNCMWVEYNGQNGSRQQTARPSDNKCSHSSLTHSLGTSNHKHPFTQNRYWQQTWVFSFLCCSQSNVAIVSFIIQLTESIKMFQFPLKLFWFLWANFHICNDLVKQAWGKKMTFNGSNVRLWKHVTH